MRILASAAMVVLLFLTGCASSEPARSGGRVTLLAPEVPEDPFVIDRQAFDEAHARGASWFIQRVRVRPVMISGRFIGFQLLSIFADEPELAPAVLRAGDIVQRVNGRSIGRPEQFMAVWESLAKVDTLSVQFLRDGRVLKATWAITPNAPETARAVSTSEGR